ncbi:hypothetical protein Agub_g12976 [Astrephomene gubernaculifera]|uniref:TANC1/2-like winged helix domain-containing protein n=1 Tax=Astrephomene gubernaculifera TaxID=47775 RepID=A0AAD3HR34_9CHLO|nr:hypothetical protein Agub_g12976 [Astrephomene gubernaculifera]
MESTFDTRPRSLGAGRAPWDGLLAPYTPPVMDDLHSPWSPPRRARTAKGRPATPTSCLNLDNVDDLAHRFSLCGSMPASPYAASARQRPSYSAGGRDSSRSPSARTRPFSSARSNPFATSTLQARYLYSNNTNTGSLQLPTPPPASAPPSQHYCGRSTGALSTGHAPSHAPLSLSLLAAPASPASTLRRAAGSTGSALAAASVSPPTSPAKSPPRVMDSWSSGAGRSASPLALPRTASEADLYATQMLAVTEHLIRVQEEATKRTASPAKGEAGVGSSSQGRYLLNLEPNRSTPLDRDTAALGQLSVVAMQQRLQHKFGEEAAAFLLHDLNQVPEHLHVLFYTVILQLRELPSPLPSSLGEAYHAVFSQHYDRTVGAAERRHAQYKAQVAQIHTQAQAQLAALEQKAAAAAAALAAGGAGAGGMARAPPPAQLHAQLQAHQRQVQQNHAAHQAELANLSAQVSAARSLHAQVMRLLCVAVAAQERLSRHQLAAMGFEGVLQRLPAWEVLFNVRDGVFLMADPSLENWLMDKRAAKQFACDPRVGHAVLGQHYRQMAEADVRSLDAYGLRYAVLHLLLSEEEVTGGERLLMDADYLEQVFRTKEEGTFFLTLLRMTHKTEVVSESLRWLRYNMGALRAHPHAVIPLWQAVPTRTLLARLVAAAAAAAAAAANGSASAAASHRRASCTTASGETSCRPSGAGDDADGDGAAERCRADGSDCGGSGGGARTSSSDDALTSPTGSSAASGGAGGGGHGGGGGVPSRKGCRPQCVLLNPPPFWNVAITQLHGHTGGVTGLVFDRRSRLLAASTAAGSVLIWDHATARRVALLTGYSPSVPCADLHPTGRLLAVGSSTDCAVRVRALDSGSGPLVTFSEPHPDPVIRLLLGPRNVIVRHLAYSPDGHLLAVVYGDGTVTVWDPVKGVRSSTMPVLNRGTAARHASFAPDGQVLALACANGTIRVWHLERLNPLHVSVLRAYEPNLAVRCVHYSPSGLLLASVAEGASEVVLWDVATGHQQQALSGGPGAAPVRAIAFSPGGLLLATAGDDGDVCLWNANTRGQWSQTACLRGHSFAVNALAFSPCGQVLATGGNEDGVRLWDVGAVLHRSEALRVENGGAGGGLGVGVGAGGAGGGAAGGGVGQYGSVGSAPAGGAILRGDEVVSSGRCPAPGVVSCLSHNPNGTQLAAGLADGAVCIWDSAAPHRFARLLSDHRRPVGRVVYSADGFLLASASDDGCICVWSTPDVDPASTRLLAAIQADSALGPSGDSVRRAGSGGGGAASVSASVAADSCSLPPLRTGQSPSGFRRHGHGAGGWVTLACSVVFNPSGSHLASAHDDGTVLIWSLPFGTLAARLHGHAMLTQGLQYSPDGRLLASSSDCGLVCVWDHEEAIRAAVDEIEPEPVARLQHRDHVYGLDFAPDSSSLATISRDGQLSTWNPRTGECTASSPHGHSTASKSSVDGVRHSPAGLLLATGSLEDGVVRLWHASSCTLLRELTGVRLMAWVGASPAPWAVVFRSDYAPFVARLPERALLLEAAAMESGSAADSGEFAVAAADEAAEGLGTAAIGVPLTPHAQTEAATHRRQEQLHRCRQLSFRPRADPLAPVVPADAPPLRPAVRAYSSTRSVPLVSFRGRSLVLADSGSTAFFTVAH